MEIKYKLEIVCCTVHKMTGHFRNGGEKYLCQKPRDRLLGFDFLARER